MKRILLIGMVVCLMAFNLVAILNKSVSANGGNMGCKTLNNCRGSATCGGGGQASGCNISCNNEATISCPPE